jgi:hypothetical protein
MLGMVYWHLFIYFYFVFGSWDEYMWWDSCWGWSIGIYLFIFILYLKAGMSICGGIHVGDG